MHIILEIPNPLSNSCQTGVFAEPAAKSERCFPKKIPKEGEGEYIIAEVRVWQDREVPREQDWEWWIFPERKGNFSKVPGAKQWLHKSVDKQ